MSNKACYMVTLSPEERSNFFALSLSKIDDDEVSLIGSCAYPYTKELFWQIHELKKNVKNKTFHEILALPEFKGIHSMYIYQAVNGIKRLCENYLLDKEKIDAILFYGENLKYISNTLDKDDNSLTETLQLGSGKMLADLTGIKVVYNIPQSQTLIEKEMPSPKNEVSFLSILSNLFHFTKGKSAENTEKENLSDLIETKVATRCIYRREKYECNEYEYDDMLNKEHMSAEEKKKVAQYTAWMRRGNQGRFGR